MCHLLPLCRRLSPRIVSRTFRSSQDFTEWLEWMNSPVDDPKKGWLSWYSRTLEETRHDLPFGKKIQAVLRRARYVLAKRWWQYTRNAYIIKYFDFAFSRASDHSKAISQPISRWMDGSINQSINQTSQQAIKQSITHYSIHRSTNQPIDSPTNQGNTQYTNRVIN